MREFIEKRNLRMHRNFSFKNISAIWVGSFFFFYSIIYAGQILTYEFLVMNLSKLRCQE